MKCQLRCGAKTSDAYWPDHRCGLPKGHENLPRSDPNRSLQHECYAVYRRKRIKRRTEVVTKPCGFSWLGDEILDYTTAYEGG